MSAATLLGPGLVDTAEPGEKPCTHNLHVAQHPDRSQPYGKEAWAVVSILKQIIAPVDRLKEQERIANPGQVLDGDRI